MENELEVINKDGQLLVDSREVALMVGKEHDQLMRSIRGYVKVLDDSAKLQTPNFFIESFYINKQNKKQPCYLITKKGCDMVANKMTGEKGILFTATYVTRFEEMENHLKKDLILHSYMIDDPIERAKKWIEEQEEKKKIETQKLMLEQQVKEFEPKVTYYDEILKSKGVVNINQIAKDYGISAQELNKILHRERIQYKQSGQWLLYAEHQGKGYTKSHTQKYTKPNGEEGFSLHTKWTQTGRLFIHSVLERVGIKANMDKEIS